MNKILKNKTIHISPESPVAKGLIKMVYHRRLREQFLRGEINLEELNRQLAERGIPKKYDRPEAV